MWRREVRRKAVRPARIARLAGDPGRSIFSHPFTRELCSGVSGSLRATSEGVSRSQPMSHMMDVGGYVAPVDAAGLTPARATALARVGLANHRTGPLSGGDSGSDLPWVRALRP